MTSFSAIAIFCEDIRQEVAGTSTIVGTLSDNLMVPGFPGALPKLAMYIRAHFSSDFNALDFNIYINGVGEPRTLIAQIDKDVVVNALTTARAAGSPMAGVIASVIASPFNVQKAGRIWLELDYGNETFYLGSLNFIDGLENAPASGEPLPLTPPTLDK